MSPITAGYIRVSTADQAERFGPDVQRERIAAYCQAMGYPAPAWFEDAETGKRWSREGFDRLVSEVRAPRVDRVVFLRLDRMGRNLRGFLALVDDVFAPHGCAVVCVDQGFDLSTSTGRLVASMLMAISQYEGEQIIERTRAGKRRSVQANGTWWGGIPPYGYRAAPETVGADGRRMAGQLEVEEGEASVVRLVDEMARNGLGPVLIARQLEVGGYRNRDGRPFCRSTVANILRRRRFYQGRATLTEASEPVAVAHPAILA